MKLPVYLKLAALSAILLLYACSVGLAQGVTTYPRTGWTVTGSSQELTGAGPINGRYTALLDGNNTTYWSSGFSGPTLTPLPHTLVFDMGVKQLVNQLYYVPRDDFNTPPTIGSVAFGDDGITFGTEIPITFKTQFVTTIFALPTIQNHRYFRITITQNQVTRDYPEDRNPVTAIAEVGAIYNTTLPVKLTSFTAQASGTGVDLQWTTALEQGSSSYTITRSLDGLTGFTAIGTVTVPANTTNASNYTFTDPNPVNGSSFYRLELTSTTGPVQKSPLTYTEFPAVVYSSSQPKNLNVFYFIPSDLAAPTDFKNRMDTIMVSLQTYFKNEMIRNGRGNKTFGLVTDAAHQKVKLIVINGKLPKSGYPRDDSSPILAEVEAYMASHPSAFYGAHSLIMLPAYSIDYNPSPSNPNYDPDGIFLQGPFGGIGKNCYAMDYDQLKQSNLGKNTRDGRNTVKFIGGLAHEMGHGFGLAHNDRKVSETALGTLLMSLGNYSYGATTTSLSETDAAVLNHNQVFNDGSLSYYGPTSATLRSVHACYNPTKKAIIVTGRVATTGASVTDVGIYNDANEGYIPGVGTNFDYDAITWTAPVIATDSFYVEEPISELATKGNSAYQMKITLIQLDGNISEFTFAYSFQNDVPQLTDPAFKPISGTITASAGTHGSISPAGTLVVSCAPNQVYTITADAGYLIESVLIDGVQSLTASSSVFSYTFTNVATKHTISATFKTSPTLSVTLTASATTVASTGVVILTALAVGGKPDYTYSFEGNLGYLDYQPTDNTDRLTGMQTGVHTFIVTVTDHTLPKSQTATATVSFTVTGGAVPVVSLSSPDSVVYVGNGPGNGGRRAASTGPLYRVVRKSANARTAAVDPDTDFAIFHFSRDNADERLPFDYTISGSVTADEYIYSNGQDAFSVGEFEFDLQIFGVSNLNINGNKTLTFTLIDKPEYDVNPENDAATITFVDGEDPNLFSITDVTTISCTPVDNRINLTFNPQYVGLDGSPVSFSVANELSPTPATGPYTLTLYADNPVITLSAVQSGTASGFIYNWLAACNSLTVAPGNTAPTLANAIPPQSATVGQGFSYVIPANTFTDAQTPNSLAISVSGLPAGLSFTAPAATISGTPFASGVSSVTVTATDPGNLSVSTTFTITVSPAGSMTSAAPFSITGVTTINCTAVANRTNISFSPGYAGLSGQPITFSVANELAATTNPGPYSLGLYRDNPVITLRAVQSGTTSMFSYNWLAACNSLTVAPGNTAPTVANVIPPRSATVGQAFSYVIPANTFTDAETPNALVLSVSGLPVGLNFTAPATISGTPSTTVGSPFSVTVTATDPGNLSVITTFTLMVSPAASVTTTVPFDIAGVSQLSCTTISAGQYSLVFNPIYDGLNGSPVSFSVANELAATTAPGPYTLRLYADNPTITLKAVQSGVTGTFGYNWLAACNSSNARIGRESVSPLQVLVLGNPAPHGQVSIEVRGAAGQSLLVHLTNLGGQTIGTYQLDRAGLVEQHTFELGAQPAGILLLRATTPGQSQTIRVIKPE